MCCVVNRINMTNKISLFSFVTIFALGLFFLFVSKAYAESCGYSNLVGSCAKSCGALGINVGTITIKYNDYFKNETLTGCTGGNFC